MTENITVKINSTDVTSKVRYPSLQVNDMSAQGKQRAYFEIDNPTTSQLEAYSDVEIYDDGSFVFGGVLVNVKESTQNSLQNIYELQYRGWKEELDTKYIGDSEKKYENEVVEYIVQDLVDDTTTDFSVVVDNHSEIREIEFKNQSITDAIDDIAQETDNYWFINADKVIYFYTVLRSR